MDDNMDDLTDTTVLSLPSWSTANPTQLVICCLLFLKWIRKLLIYVFSVVPYL